MLLRVSHETRLSYSAPVSETVFEVRMGPMSDEDQTTLGYRLRVEPTAPVTGYRDGFGNRVDLFNIPTPHREVVVRATSFVRTHRRPGQTRLAQLGAPGSEPVGVEALEYLRPSPLVNDSPEVAAFCDALKGESSSTLADVVERVMEAVGSRLRYEKAVTTAKTDVTEALSLGRGVCQDFVHLCLAGCRGLGLPARYVSGYINQPGELATHAWVQVWGGTSTGWIDVDPTRRCYGGDDYVVTAVGRDYTDVPPNRGLWRGRAQETIAVSVSVEPADRMPPDWYDLGPPAGYAEAGQYQFQSQSQSQSQRSGSGSGPFQMQRQGNGRSHGGMNFQGTRSGYRSQQGQQQQT